MIIGAVSTLTPIEGGGEEGGKGDGELDLSQGEMGRGGVF